MKKMKSLILTFTLAAAAVGFGAGSAQAQTTPVGQGQAITVTQNQPAAQADLVNNNFVADEVVNAVSQLPMNSVYGRAGLGFTSARVDQTGENVGVEYQLNGSNRTPIRAYNLDDAYGAQQFESARLAAAQTENRLALEATRVYPSVVYVQPSYVYVRPIRPVILLGPIFRPWQPIHIFSPFPFQYHQDNYRHDGYRNDGYRPHYNTGPTIIIAPRVDNHRNDNNWNNHGNNGNHQQQPPRGGHDKGPGGHHR